MAQGRLELNLQTALASVRDHLHVLAVFGPALDFLKHRVAEELSAGVQFANVAGVEHFDPALGVVLQARNTEVLPPPAIPLSTAPLTVTNRDFSLSCPETLPWSRKCVYFNTGSPSFGSPVSAENFCRSMLTSPNIGILRLRVTPSTVLSPAAIHRLAQFIHADHGHHLDFVEGVVNRADRVKLECADRSRIEVVAIAAGNELTTCSTISDGIFICLCAVSRSFKRGPRLTGSANLTLIPVMISPVSHFGTEVEVSIVGMFPRYRQHAFSTKH